MIIYGNVKEKRYESSIAEYVFLHKKNIYFQGSNYIAKPTSIGNIIPYKTTHKKRNY